MTVSLPRIDSALAGSDGRPTREWYKALSATVGSVNGVIAGQTIYTDTGPVNYLAINSGIKSYSRGLVRYLVPKYTNTLTTVTLSDSGLSAAAIKLSDGSLPVVGQIVAGVTTQVIYNGTNWELQISSSSSAAITGNATVGGALAVTGATTLTGGVAGNMVATGAVSGTTLTASTYLASGTIAVGSLPAAATAGASARYFVTDSNVVATGNFGNVVAAGGANKVPVYSDGTNWRIG